MNCTLMFQQFIDIYLKKNKWTTAELETLLNKYKYHDFSVHEEKEIMDDCY